MSYQSGNNITIIMVPYVLLTSYLIHRNKYLIFLAADDHDRNRVQLEKRSFFVFWKNIKQIIIICFSLTESLHNYFPYSALRTEQFDQNTGNLQHRAALSTN